jgi:hypothetical protein
MSGIAQKQNIMRFVQNTLGCQCTEEVFDSIELERGGAPIDGTGFVKMVVGNKLLIYIVKPAPEFLTDHAVQMLTETGRLERDNKGYNRFRLVLARHSCDAISHTAVESFRKSVGHDEKAHIHIVSIEELPDVPEIA